MKQNKNLPMFAAVGSSSCMILGGAAAISMLNDFIGDDNTLSFDEDVRLTLAETDETMPLEEALTAAREQTGSQGVFVNNGMVYATVSKTEWEQKSPAEQHVLQSLTTDDESMESIAVDDVVVVDEQTAEDEPVEVSVEEPIVLEKDDDEEEITDDTEMIFIDEQDEEDGHDDEEEAVSDKELEAKGDDDLNETDTMDAFIYDADVSMLSDE